MFVAAGSPRKDPANPGLNGRSYIQYNVTHMRFFGNSWPVTGEFEQLVLFALVRLGNGAFGAAIHREITTRTGRDMPVSAVYVTLERLEAKRMVCSYVGNPTRQRGGRRRKHYLLDTAGQRALVRAYRTFQVMTAGIQQDLEALSNQLLPGSAAARTSRKPAW